MSLDIAALVFLGLLFALGAWRGFLPSLLGLSSLVIGYLGAVGAAKLSGGAVGAALGWPVWIAAPAVGTAGFVASVIGFGVMTGGLRRRDRERAADEGRALADRLFGGVLGATRGAVIVVLLGLLVGWLDAARDATGSARLANVPDTEDSIAVAVSGRAVEAAVSAAVGDDGAAGVASRFLARPSAALAMLQSIAQDPSLRSLQSDPVFWMYVEQGQAHNAVHRPAFHDLVESDELRRQLAALGAISDEAAARPDVFRRDMQDVLQQLGPRLRALKQDPEVQALAEDPEVRAHLESGDPWALLSDVRIHRIASRMAEGP
ncbi:MAG: CvpA family protein [Myxococcota bacterium]|nr:CvpA family protein [Myxococcota bacterium]